MGEEVKKAEEETKKSEEEEKAEKPKPEEKKPDESKDSKDAPPQPPPAPPVIVLKVYMHCEGCARKVRRCLKGFDGVEDVSTDCKAHKVMVKGEKADPVKVLERVQRKSHRQVELLSPIPKPPSEDPKKDEEKEKPKPEEKKDEAPPEVTVVLRVHMHCEACAQEMKKRIHRMNGVNSVEPDLKSSEVTVKGVFDPPKLVEYVYKRTGKHAVIVEEEEEDDSKGKDGKEEKMADGEASAAAEEEKKGAAAEGEAKGNNDGGDAVPVPVVVMDESGVPLFDVKKSEYYYYYHQPQFYPSEPTTAYSAAYPMLVPAPAYPPQIFSDENPNACSVM